MNCKTEAIVLHAVKYGESRMIVDVFTREAGRLSFVVSLPRTARGRVKKQFFQPATLLWVEFDLRPRVQLQQLRDVRLSHPYASLPFEPAKLAQTFFVAEFLRYALRSEQRNEPLYDYVQDSLLWLDAAPDGYANFHLTFLMRLSRFLGFYPNLDAPDGAGQWVFDLRAGCFAEQVPLHRDYLEPGESQRIRLLMRMDYTTMRLFRLSRQERNRCVEVLVQYYRLHLPDFPPLRSLSVLQELWD